MIITRSALTELNSRYLTNARVLGVHARVSRFTGCYYFVSLCMSLRATRSNRIAFTMMTEIVKNNHLRWFKHSGHIVLNLLHVEKKNTLILFGQ